MAAIDYYGIQEQMQTILAAYTGLRSQDGVQVLIEEDFTQVMGSIDNGKAVIIYLDDRAPTAAQPLAANTRTRFAIGLSVWVFACGIDSFKAVANIRDDLMGLVEVALMANSNLNNGVAFSFLGGGEFQSARKPGAGVYMAMGECKVIAEAMASTT
jgi:hypothetical protein